MNKAYICLLTGISLTLAACANPYAKFYQSYNGYATSTPSSREQSCSGPIKIYSSSDIKHDVQYVMRHGYVPIGQSSFEAGGKFITRSNILRQARAVGACLVLAISKRSRMVSGAIPITLPHNSTSYTTGTASAYGSGGYATAYGNSTTQTYGSQTVMIPYSVQRFDAGAIFFRKLKYKFGAFYKDVPEGLSAKIGHNGGLLVTTVIQGGPAFQADIFEGDVILAVEGKRFNTINNGIMFSSILKSGCWEDYPHSSLAQW